MPKHQFRADGLLPSEITPRRVYEQRRQLLKAAAAGLAFAPAVEALGQAPGAQKLPGRQSAIKASMSWSTTNCPSA